MRGEEGIAVAMKDKTRGKMKWQDGNDNMEQEWSKMRQNAIKSQ
jgi:hypothetical protein